MNYLKRNFVLIGKRLNLFNEHKLLTTEAVQNNQLFANQFDEKQKNFILKQLNSLSKKQFERLGCLDSVALEELQNLRDSSGGKFKSLAEFENSTHTIRGINLKCKRLIDFNSLKLFLSTAAL